MSVIARGAHLEVIRQRGLTLRSGGEERVARLPASDDPRELGEQDYVICALKAHQAFENAAAFAPLLSDSTSVVTARNGIPWWYFHQIGGSHEGHTLQTVDPGACEVVSPGVIVHHRFDRFILGEPDGCTSGRLRILSEALIAAGFDAPVRDNIRWNIWLKLWGNVCFNPISALTGSTLGALLGNPELRSLWHAMMLEAKAVNEALGVSIPLDMMERRLNAAAAVGDHKMSMLQDLERGRSLEIDALAGAVQELGLLTGVATPHLDGVLALLKERARGLGLYTPLNAAPRV